MLKHLVTIEAAFHLTKPRNGFIIHPELSTDFINSCQKRKFTGILIFPDGRQQQVHAHLIHAHFSGRPAGLPSWTTECFLEGVEAVPVGTELWCNEQE